MPLNPYLWILLPASIIQNRQAAGWTDGDTAAVVRMEHYRSG